MTAEARSHGRLFLGGSARRSRGRSGNRVILQGVEQWTELQRSTDMQ